MAYKHDEKEIHKACGFTDEQLKELFEKANGIAKEAQDREAALSEIVESYENDLSKVELALLLISTQNELAQFRMLLSQQAGMGVPQGGVGES